MFRFNNRPFNSSESEFVKINSEPVWSNSGIESPTITLLLIAARPFDMGKNWARITRKINEQILMLNCLNLPGGMTLLIIIPPLYPANQKPMVAAVRNQKPPVAELYYVARFIHWCRIA